MCVGRCATACMSFYVSLRIPFPFTEMQFDERTWLDSGRFTVCSHIWPGEIEYNTIYIFDRNEVTVEFVVY